MRAGVGFRDEEDPRASARGAFDDALASGGVARPSLVLAFCGGGLDAPAFFEALRACVGAGVPILGGSAIGVVTSDALSYAGQPAAIAVLELDEPLAAFAAVGGLADSEVGAGRALGERLAGAAGSTILALYDSVKVAPTAGAPPVMNAAPPLIQGIEEAFGRPALLVGGGLLGDYGFSPTWQFCGSFAAQQHVAAAVFGPKTRAVVRVMHGCTPMDGVYHTLTSVEGSVIHAIDGRPAAQVIDQVYGSQQWRSQRPLLRLAIGVNGGEAAGASDEASLVNRLITGALPGSESIGLFEPDLGAGTEFLFMLRDGNLMVESARKNTVLAVERMLAEGAVPRFALYIDCAGRAAAASDTLTEEAAEVQAVLAEHGVPLLGFYSGVEIAPMGGRSRGLDWTGVLLLLGDEVADG